MFCPKCGQEIPEHAAFCPKCGQRVNQKPSTSSNQRTEKSDIAGTENSPFGGNPLYPKIALGAAAVVVVALVIVLLVSGTGGSDKSSVAWNGASTGPAVNNNQAANAVQNQGDQAKAKLAEADSAFSSGNYDTALRLYRDIDTDYAKTRVRAIECIPIADAVAKDWLEATDNEANEIVMAAFDLNFTFDTEYDPQTYTFYTKMYYPALYTSLAGAFVSRETIEEGVTSSGHEKTAYEMFCERGYEDITCVSNMYDSDGGLLASFPYNKAIYEADLEKERQESERAEQLKQENEQQRKGHVEAICSDAEALAAAQNLIDRALQPNIHKKDWVFAQAVSKYIGDHQESWPEMSIINVEVVGEIEYGELWGEDDREKAEEELVYYSAQPYKVMIHLPCTVPLYIKYSAKSAYGDSEDTISCVATCDMVFQVQPQTDPLNMRCALEHPYTIISMEKTGIVQHFLKDEDFDNETAVILPDASSYAQGYVGNIFRAQFFDFAIESVSISCPSETQAGNINAVAAFSNWTEYEQPIYDTFLQIKWSVDGPSEYASPFYGEIIAEPQSIISVNYNYDLPIGCSAGYLTFTEYFSDGSVGATFDIDISPLISRAQQAQLWGRPLYY